MIIRRNILLKIEEGDITDGTCIIPSGTVCIHDAAFRDCLGLKRLIIPKSVTHIGNLAFWGCRNLKSIRLSESLKFIGNAAFRGCESLEEITFPKGLTSTGNVAFSGCTNLRTVIFQERGTRIKYNAFNSCPALTQIRQGNVYHTVKCIDDICMRILWEKTKNGYTVFKCQDFPAQSQTLWAAEKDGIAAYGTSLTGAIRNLDFKLLKDLPVDEHIARVQSQGYVTPMDYSMITGMEIRSTDRFLNRKRMSWNAKWTVEEAITLTEGEYGHETFTKALHESGCI
ncbi:MAG: leucine-rich repeat domain-containing protein [Lachnospiraceae bacterium]|nr:leucine-rich repeat domain-containing protein [Lachnospiraceae bacterium]